MIAEFALPIAIIIAILCYLCIILLLPKSVTQSQSQHFRLAMQRLEEQQKRVQSERTSEYIKPRSHIEHSILVRALLALPGAQHVVAFVDKAGLIGQLDKIILVGLVLFIVLSVLLNNMGMLGVLFAAIITLIGIYMFLKLRINKRRKLFMNMFPDALDIIVRSVKSGYPINSAIGMVADSLPKEVGAEYLRIMHEASYGYSLTEAVERFVERMDEPDVSFFGVVISLQQETGGNLAEILANLSQVIRQRQQLKLKIRALSSEGRMTVVILVGIAICMVAAVHFMTPGHFDRLLNTSAGHTVMMFVAGAFALAFFTIRRIINFKI